jgi:hypothetical protein
MSGEWQFAERWAVGRLAGGPGTMQSMVGHFERRASPPAKRDANAIAIGAFHVKHPAFLQCLFHVKRLPSAICRIALHVKQLLRAQPRTRSVRHRPASRRNGITAGKPAR